MTQGLFGAVAPAWTGMTPAPAWPAIGAAFTGAETLPGALGSYGLSSGFAPVTTPGFGYANPGLPSVISGNIGTPFIVPGGVPAATVIAAMAMRRGQPQGPTTDQDVEELLYDAIELMPGGSEVEIRCEGGRVSLNGSVPNKRVKHDFGELAWAIPGINDVQNGLNITTRRKSRGFNREPEAQPSAPGRKQG
jgi:hypothetical protein